MQILRAGKAPFSVRRKAAEGGLPVSLDEKIEILVALCRDPDESICARALITLENWDAAELKQVMANSETPPAVLEFAVRRLVPGRKELAEVLACNPALPDTLRSGALNGAEAPTRAEAEEAYAPAILERETLLQKISRMTVAEKINAALMGSQEERVLLVRDSNKIVARAVLQSPKLSDQEVENIATMKNVSEEVLRMVAMNRKFIRGYGVAHNLINNPRTPIDAGLPLIHRLNDRDLKELSRNKNVAEVIRSMAAKLVRQKEAANRTKLPGKH